MVLLGSVFEIVVLWVIFYQLFRLFRGSQAAAIMGGLLVTVLLGVVLLRVTHAEVLQEMAGPVTSAVTLLAILFQAEIRTMLARVGNSSVLRALWVRPHGTEGFISRVCESVTYLASHRFGALIAICRRDKLQDVTTGTVKLDAEYSRALIGTIFMPKTLLHDGAVIVDNERIVCAKAMLPMSERELKDLSMGMRHRAGIGLAERSDAVVIIVSEETGTVSLAVGNELSRNITTELLGERLEMLLNADHENTDNKGQVSGNHQE